MTDLQTRRESASRRLEGADPTPAQRAPTGQVTRLLDAHAQGDAEALDRLIPLVYDDLRRIAHRHLAGEETGHTLDTGAVVHEAYLRLVAQTRVHWPDRVRFFAFTSRIMRHVLVDYARRRQRRKRGGGLVRVPFEDLAEPARYPTLDLLALSEAMTRLSAEDPRAGRVAECRLFGGMRLREVAEALDISLSTAERDWRYAKACLYRALSSEEGA